MLPSIEAYIKQLATVAGHSLFYPSSIAEGLNLDEYYVLRDMLEDSRRPGSILKVAFNLECPTCNTQHPRTFDEAAVKAAIAEGVECPTCGEPERNLDIEDFSYRFRLTGDAQTHFEAAYCAHHSALVGDNTPTTAELRARIQELETKLSNVRELVGVFGSALLADAETSSQEEFIEANLRVIQRAAA